jgi:CSLREA domain-containing protein
MRPFQRDMMRTWARVVTLTVTFLIAVGAGQAAAATLTVTTFDDNSGSGDGLCSLREAIAAVDSPGTPGGDCQPAAFGANTIVIRAGTTVLTPHFDTTSPVMSDLVISPTVTSLTIVGAGASKTTIAGGPDLFTRLLRISSGASVTIKDLTVTGGRAQIGAAGANGTGGDGDAGINGGAILNEGSLTLSDAAVTNSHAGAGGAGGYGAGAFGAGVGATGGPGGVGGSGGSGGAIYNTGTLTLQGATIAGNSAGAGGAGGQGGDGTVTGGPGGDGGPGGEGGGVANVGGTLIVVDSTFNSNDAGDGGGAGFGGSGPTPGDGATAGNGAAGGSGSGGGGIVSTGGTLSITNSTFASNDAGRGGDGGVGGGVSGGDTAGAGGNGGTGGNGGGIQVLGVGSSSLQSVTIAGNNAGAGGAGGHGGSGSPTGADGTAGPSGAGGGIVSQGTTTTVQNSVLASNTSGNCSASVFDAGHNLSFGSGGCPATFGSSDPNLGPLDDNGGPAQTISLGPGSAAIDAVPATSAGCPATDERGVVRPKGAGCDIGAYEVAPPTASTGRAKSITPTSAIVTASVNPNAGDAVVQFQFGKSAKYTSKTAVQHVGGVAAVTVTKKITGLFPKTKYHYRVTVVAPDGTVKAQDRTFKTANGPALTRLSVKPARFRASGPGATITYFVSQAATTTLTVQRCTKPLAHGGCGRFVKVATLAQRGRRGRHTLLFPGPISRRKLSPGIYRVNATARAGRKTGNTATAKFQILA